VPIDNALHLVESRLITAFLAALPTGIISANVKYPNANFTTPNNQPWARLESPQSFGPISTDASGCYEINDGVFRVSLFWPKGSGSTAAMTAAHEVKELYGQPDYDDVTITSVVVSPTPEPDDSLWFGVRINVNFQYEGFRS
jgi:hypothetical protein